MLSDRNSLILAIILIVALFAGFYYYQHKDDKTLHLQIGNKDVSATITDGP